MNEFYRKKLKKHLYRKKITNFYEFITNKN